MKTIKQLIRDFLEVYPSSTNKQIKTFVEDARNREYKHNLSGSLIKSVRDEVLPYVFVYGSLLRGLGNYRLLQEIEAKFICEDKIRGKLFTAHWSWPFAKLTNDDNFIKGEVFRIYPDTIRHLDGLEGYRPDYPEANCLFLRRKIKTESGKTVFVYEAGQSLLNNQNVFEIKDGDWKKAYACNWQSQFINME